MRNEKNKSYPARRPAKGQKPYVSADDRFYSRPKRTERPQRPARPAAFAAGRFPPVTEKLRGKFPDVKRGLLDRRGGGCYAEGTPTTTTEKGRSR